MCTENELKNLLTNFYYAIKMLDGKIGPSGDTVIKVIINSDGLEAVCDGPDCDRYGFVRDCDGEYCEDKETIKEIHMAKKKY